MNRKTIDERIEEASEEYKQRLREKMGAVMTIEWPNAITLEGLESIWGQAKKEAGQITDNIFNDIVNDNLQNELLRKKN